MALRIAIPAKGRLLADAVNWFQSKGIEISMPGSVREYSGVVTGAGEVEVLRISASEIPGGLVNGDYHIGITGTDLVHEKIPAWKTHVEEIALLGFGRADLVVAVPKVWVDVRTLDDLDEVAAQFRSRHGRRLRIATKYRSLLREFLGRNGVADYQIVLSQGATEGSVANQTAEAIADIVSTGETMRVNGLKPIEDGVILRSQATLYLSNNARLNRLERLSLKQLVLRINSDDAGAEA